MAVGVQALGVPARSARGRFPGSLVLQVADGQAPALSSGCQLAA